LNNMRNNYMRSWTYTHHAIYYAWLASRQHGRSGVQQVVVTLTDGRSTRGLYLDPGSDPVPDGTTSQLYAPDLFHNYGITSFAVGVGSGVNNLELQEIASDPDEDYLISISSYSSMDDFILKIGASVCQTSNDDDDNNLNRSIEDSIVNPVLDSQIMEFIDARDGFPGFETDVFEGDELVHSLPTLPETRPNIGDEGDL